MLNATLEIARGLAALWVFVYHLRLLLPPGLFRSVAEGGFLGVPAFFVISGYCMMASSQATIAKGQPASSFLRRRLRRIFPPFWGSILVVVAVPFIAAGFAWLRGFAPYWPAPRWREYSLLDWAELATLTKGLLWQGPAHKPYSAVNSAYWSLAIEIQFYAVMALGLLVRRWFLVCLAAVTLGSLAFWFFIGPIAPGLFPEYWPMFALGILLHYALDKGFRPARLFGKWTAPLSAVTLSAILATALGLTLYAPSESLQRQTVFAVVCAFIFWAASGVESWLAKPFLPTRAFVGLGKMSYSVYLLHLQLGSLAMSQLRPVLPRGGLLSPLICIAATLPLIWVFYHFCEKRFIGSGKPKPRPPKPAVKPAEPELAPVTARQGTL